MKKCKKAVFYSYINSGNRGCEAILRSTYDILQLKENETYVFTDDIEGDTKCGIHHFVKLLKIPYIYVKQFKPLSSIIPRMLRVFKIDKNALWKYKYNRYKKLIDDETLCLSTGGDIYCYGDNDWLTYLNSMARKRGAQTVLWGCSIEKSMMDERVVQDLKNYSLITVRESITQANLASMGIKDNVVLYPDPAFKLKPEHIDIFDWEKMGKIFGLNLSVKIVQNQNLYENFKKLIRYILTETEYAVLLVPHVFWDSEDDLALVKKLYNEIGANEKLYIVDKPYNCAKLKDIIAHCDIYMGARTHSVIAAYSSCVPAVALSYSIKSRGIARDIFGSEEHLVVKVDAQTKYEDIKESFDYLKEHEAMYRTYLKEHMPEYISRIDDEQEVVEKLF
jgi:colanic acid/amylovoran biosynthesis protein